MKKLLTLIVLLVAVVGSYADTETLLTYTITAADTANSQVTVAAGAGTFYIGAAKGKVAASDYTSSGYAYKLDGDNSSTNTKYALLTLADGVTFEAGDIISVQYYATSTPSEEKPYGIGIYTSLGGDVIANDTCSAKNTLDTWNYVVTSNDGIEGVSAIYLQRNDGCSVYFYSVTITRESTSSDDDDDTTTGTELTADIELTSNTPESEGTVTELSEVVIDVDADDWALNVDSAMAYVTLYSKTGGIYTVDTIVKNDEGQLVISTETITDEVTLTLSIPEGILGDSEWNTSGGVYGHTNATAVFYYIVAADEEETSYEWVTEPAEGTVESLDTILVYIGDKTTALSVTWNVNPTISDADGNTTEINVNKQVNAQYDTDWSTYSYSWLEVILPEAVTTAGTYTLTFPSGSLTVEDATYETEVAFTWEVTGTTTEDEEEEEELYVPTNAYNLTIKPTNGKTLNQIDTVYVTFEDYTSVNYTSYPYIYTYADGAYTMISGNYMKSSCNGNVLTLTAKTAVTDAGTYYIIIPSSKIVVGTSALGSDSIYITYVVDPDAVVEDDEDTDGDDDEEDEEVTYSIESITITEGAELDSIKSGETLQFSIEPYSKIGYAFTKIGTTAGGGETKSRSALTYNSETTYWEQEVYNDIALVTGTYYLTIVAYATENDFNYGNDPLVSDTISFTGTAEEYSYSEYTLVSVDPENESEVSSKEDLNVTLTFSGAVNINSSTSFVNYGQGVTYPFDAITSSDGADYSTTWTLTVSSSTLSILGDGATLTVVAADETGARVYDETLSEGSDSYTYLHLYYEFGDAGLTGFTISPEEGTVDSLYSFVLSYEGATAIAPSWTAYPTLYDADGDTIEYINDNVVADADALTVTFTLSEAVTTEGTYTLNIPKQTVLINDDASSYNAELTYTYTVTGATVTVCDSLLIDSLAEYTGGQVLTGEYCTVTLGEETWTNKGANAGAGDPFYAYIIGAATNPVDSDGKKWSASGNVPTTGAYYVVTPTVDGTVTTGVVINAGKYLLIVKESDSQCLTLDEITNNSDYELTETDGIPTTVTKIYASISFEATANESYYIFTEGSKIGTYGVVFEAQVAEEEEEEEEEVVETPYCFTTDDSLTYYIPVDQSDSICSAYNTANGTEYSGYLVYTTGQTLYANEYFTLTSATDYGYVAFSNPSKKSTMEAAIEGLDISNYGYVNLGSQLGQQNYSESLGDTTTTTITFSDDAIDASNVSSSWQAILSFTPTVNGTLGYSACVTNARSIAIYKVPTLEETQADDYTGDNWVAITNFGSDDWPKTVEGYVEAGNEYWLIAGTNNVEVYELSFEPGDAEEEEEEEEEETTIVCDSLLIDSLATYTGGQILTGEYCTVTLGEDTWTNKGANSGAGDPFYAYIIGTNNPVDDSSAKWSSSGNLPTVGAYYIVSPTVDGTVTTGVVINAAKYVLIVKESDNTYLTLDEITCSEELTETDGIPTVGDTKLYGTLTFEATAGENYYIFTEGSKLGTYGVVFEASVEEEDDTDDTDDTEDTDGISNVSTANSTFRGISADANGNFNVYTISGQRVVTTKNSQDITNLPTGLYIVNGAKVAVK